jgi:DNA-binding MarR family transcriptional regulator
MQASSPAPAAPATTSELSDRLLSLWKYVAREAGAELSDLLEELDLSMAHVKTLEALATHATSPSVKQLSTSLRCSLANSSRSVDALVRRGLLERREDDVDRRVKRLTVTDAGLDALAQIDGLRLVALERFAQNLSPDQRDRLTAALDGLPLTPAD